MTLLLERLRGRTLLVNDPRGLRDANEKLYTLHFARTRRARWSRADRDRILASWTRSAAGGRQAARRRGGRGVMMLPAGDKNNRAILDMLTAEGRRFAMVQEYLPAVRQGDKRVLLLDGAGAGRDQPRPARGRSPVEHPRRRAGGALRRHRRGAGRRRRHRAAAPADGLFFVGLDFIGGKLTEVNVTSPTGIQELSRHEGRDVAADVIAWVERQATTSTRI